MRLRAEYLEAELRLRAHGVRSTILVMGSTRASRRHPYYAVAREFGRIVARDGRHALMTGGGPGIMEAANRGAFEVGGLSIGLNIRLPREQVANRYLTPGLAFSFRYFALRKLHFLLRAHCTSVRVSNSSSKVPKPPGNATKACARSRKCSFLSAK